MKTINFFKSALLAAILLIGGNAWGQLTIDDVLTAGSLGLGGGYNDFSNVSGTSGAVYAGNAMKSSANAIQMRSKENNSGIVTTTSGGTPTKITVTWNSATTASRTLNIYGSETPYSQATDLYSSTTRGTLIGSIPNGTTELILDQEFPYIGIRSQDGALYLDNLTITWKSAFSVATPEFSIPSGKYAETQNVEISCVTDGATIYYTLDGSDPTESGTAEEYTAPIKINTTTTLKAVAMDAEANFSSVASATYTFPTEVANIAAFNATTEGDFVKITGEITIVFSDGNSSVYAQDASGSMLIYDYNYVKTEGLTNGKTLTGLIGTTDNYNGPQMTDVIAPALGEGTPVEPAVVSEVTVDDLHKFVKLENVQFTETCDLSSRGDQGTLTSNLLVYNRLYNVSLGTAIQGKNYDIEGFVSVFNGTAQLYPISLEVNEPAFYYSENSLAFGRVENNQSKELTFTLRGEKLTADATLAVSGDNAAMFTVSPASVTKADDGTIAETTITVTYTPTEVGEHTANLTITSGELVSTIALSGEGILPVLATPVATAATTITANSFVANWDAVDNATSYELSVWKTPKPGDGTESAPYSVAEFLAAQPNGSVYVRGYIVGRASSGTNYTINDPSDDTNFALADETGENKTFIPVQLPSGDLRDNWGLKTNGDKLNKYVVVQGLATEYFKVLGIKSTSSITETVYVGDEPVSGSPFTVTETSLAITGLTAETNYRYSVVAKAEGYTDSEVSNIIDVTTSKGSGTGLCRPATLEGVSFDGQVIRNAAGLELSVYTVSGVCVKTAVGDIDMSAMPHGIYLVRSANAVLKITK